MNPPRTRPHPLNHITIVLAAAMFLAMQLIGGAHFHSPPEINHFASASQASSADQCPICLHHSNSTPALGSALPFAVPLCLVAALKLDPQRTVALEIRFALFGRAPPATV
ncbi:MAG TPA: hypothetical protein VMA09_18550 [Candidatus Binataceae bacterium]|nr:hypothetical protein [Candidatus Binataceae bacterium]